MGIVFQVPVGILAVTRTGLVSVKTLRRNRRYAFVICFVVATPLPGTDPVSMIVESLMLYVLYEVGILLSAIFVRPREPAALPDDVTVSSES
jgi:sec-independent protein translocase protein TatC